ncbi:MAG: ankyrin repeat domain-containing protein [Candidatus Riflebacteria bacterium]
MHKLTSLIVSIFLLAILMLAGCSEKAPTRDEWESLTFWKTVSVDQVKAGLKAGHDPNFVFSNGHTPLIMASLLSSSPEVVKTLLEGGAKIDAGNQNFPPLIAAASKNPSPEVISLLITHGADVNQKGINGITAILMAAEHNPNPKVFQALIDAGANLDARIDDGPGVVDLALKNVKAGKKIREILDSLGKKADFSDKQVLKEFETLCRLGSYYKMKEMIDAGYDLKKSFEFGSTPLIAALTAEKLETNKIMLLLEHKAPVHHCSEYYRSAVIELVGRFYGPKITGFHKKRQVPLNTGTKMAEEHNHKVLEEIVDQVEMENDGQLHNKFSYDEYKGDFSCLKNLESNEATLVEILQKLKEAGADFASTDQYGNNPLHLAIMGGAGQPVVGFLMQCGVSNQQKNKQGLTPENIFTILQESH